MAISATRKLRSQTIAKTSRSKTDAQNLSQSGVSEPRIGLSRTLSTVIMRSFPHNPNSCHSVADCDNETCNPKRKEPIMNRICKMVAVPLALASLTTTAGADETQNPIPNQPMVQMDSGHMQGMMGEGMLAFPVMDPANGRKLFGSKGCVVCHSINGLGGEDAPKLDASIMQPMMNPFEFAARMWHGAEAMVAMQREELGEPIQLNGQELADLVAFAHSHKEQAKFTLEDVPEKIQKLINHNMEGMPEHHDNTQE